MKAGKDVLAQLVEKNIATFNMQYIMALINAEVAPLPRPSHCLLLPNQRRTRNRLAEWAKSLPYFFSKFCLSC